MRIGRPGEGVRGLEHSMNVSEDLVHAGMLAGTAAIIQEVEALGDPNLTEALHELALCNASNVPSLSSFVAHERSITAGLKEPHVVAIRLYSCAAGFHHFNDPMRDPAREATGKPHQLPVTMAFLADGIRKLRSLYQVEHGNEGGTSVAVALPVPPPSPQASRASDVITLYRGLHNLTLADSFIANRAGGTELGVSSTTSSFDVAVSFMLQSTDGTPTVPPEILLLRLIVRNCNRYGGAIAYLSVNPSENEVLYPPLTYFEPTGDYQIEHLGSTRLTVIDVVPI